MIADVQRQIADRDETLWQLEADLGAVRGDVEHLAIEMERNEMLLKDADEQTWRLQATKKQMAMGLEEETLKLRHANIDFDSSAYSSRSEMSTVCTMRDHYSPPPNRGTPMRSTPLALTATGEE
eukprot:gnl/TRDRNA2_/TRDRNA2_172194_c4_seq1.p1 gnl/TRDRNA2_/TRDRNA2_172194_c4~~gnl/TRDRNA2_/TRDRNA2_172194_c4_seq1.p1  ORF type:complete len:139 (-),score=36.01 gnl/TRDRNA2_/TRDRNA2_172194_c4_seq1:104-475(-)